MQKKKLKISVISQIHYCKLVLRSQLHTHGGSGLPQH